MVRMLRWLGGAVFGLCLAALIPFLVEKGAEPKGHAVLWILYGALLVSAAAWFGATIASHVRARMMALEIKYSLDSSDEMAVSLRRERPQFVLLCVSIRNPNPFNIEGVAINVVIPQSFHGMCCSSRGDKLEQGRWITTLEPLPGDSRGSVYKDCWADNDVTLAGDGSKLVFFRMRATEAGVYHFKTMLFGNAPKQDSIFSLEVLESQTMTVGGTIGELLLEGEALSDPRSDQHVDEFSIWMEKLADVVRSLAQEDRDWWANAIADAPPYKPHPDLARLAIASRIPSLYDLRRRLDSPGSALARAFRGGLYKRA